MFYCSKEHQKEDWKHHKKVCSYLATAAEEVGADNFFGHQIEFEDEDEVEVEEERPNEKSKSWKSWTKFRVNAVKMCEILTGRPLAPFEKEVFLFPRACRQCRMAKKDGMIDCHDCMSVTFCSEQHMQVNTMCIIHLSPDEKPIFCRLHSHGKNKHGRKEEYKKFMPSKEAIFFPCSGMRQIYSTILYLAFS